MALVEAYCRAQGFWGAKECQYTDVLQLDLSTVEPSIAGPKRPQDRIALKEAKQSFQASLNELRQGKAAKKAQVAEKGQSFTIEDGAIVIAAITSCTNTSNPAVLLAAGLLAQKAAEKGLRAKPWVKTSLAPGSRVVTEYLKEAGLLTALEKLAFTWLAMGVPLVSATLAPCLMLYLQPSSKKTLPLLLSCLATVILKGVSIHW